MSAVNSFVCLSYHHSPIFLFLLSQTKCEAYWPTECDRPVTYGPVEVTMTDTIKLADYTIRNFSIIRCESQHSCVDDLIVYNNCTHPCNTTYDTMYLLEAYFSTFLCKLQESQAGRIVSSWTSIMIGICCLVNWLCKLELCSVSTIF